MVLTTRSWKVRRYSQSDLSELLRLGTRCFPEAEDGKFDSRFWNWEFLDNPAGPAYIWVAAEPNGKLVGHYAIIPTRWWFDGVEILGSIVVDVMSDRDYRHQGIFAELSKTSLQVAGRDGVKFFYGFPVRRGIMVGYREVGGKVVFSIPVWVRPVHLEKLLQHYINFRPLQILLKKALESSVGFFLRKQRRPARTNLSLKEIKEFDHRFEEFSEATKKQWRMIQARDSKFLNWRYFNNPFRKYVVYTAERRDQLVGYIVLRQLRLLEFECVAIVDLLVRQGESEALDLLIENAIWESSQREGLDLIACMISRGNFLEARLRHHFFLDSLKKFNFLLKFNSDNDLSSVMIDSKNWFLTWGDTDVV